VLIYREVLFNWLVRVFNIYCMFPPFINLYSRVLLFEEDCFECVTDCRMIIVMTMNVGYFFAVLAGIFFGELVFGRWITGGHLRSSTGQSDDSVPGGN